MSVLLPVSLLCGDLPPPLADAAPRRPMLSLAVEYEEQRCSRVSAGALYLSASTIKLVFFCFLWQTAEVGVLTQLSSGISGVQSVTLLSWKHLWEVMSCFMTACFLMSCVYLTGPRVHLSHDLRSHPGVYQQPLPPNHSNFHGGGELDAQDRQQQLELAFPTELGEGGSGLM